MRKNESICRRVAPIKKFLFFTWNTVHGSTQTADTMEPHMFTRNQLRIRFITEMVLIFLAALGLSGCASTDHAGRTPSDLESSVYIEKNVAVPMRDGVILRADVRRPSQDGKYPVLLFRTPYSKDEGDPDNEKTFTEAIKRGYAVVIQDVRGRFESGGEFVAYVNEGKDGYDTIEWAAAQPWSDGRTGTFGLSYPGAVQWLAAIENPPHLKAMVPAMCFSSLDQFIYFGGVFESAWAGWSYKYISPDLRIKKNLPGPRTIEETTALWDSLGGSDIFQGWLPYGNMPYLKDTSPYFYSWLEHQPYDRWWDFGNLHDKYPHVKAAVLNLSGWYDEPYGSEGAITNFLGLLKSRANAADPATRLIIGPWIHGVDATGIARSGDRVFAENAIIDYHKLVLDWLDYYVRGIDNGVASQKPVQVYNMGSNIWVHADVWPLQNTNPMTYYLSPGQGSGQGTIQTVQPALDQTISFVSDPLAPVKDEFGTNFGAYDLRNLSNRPDLLTFETTPFAADTAVIGHIGAEIFASSDAPDFDLYVKILDVAPDGTAFNIETAGHEVLRASRRDMTVEKKLLGPNEVVKLTFRNMVSGNTFKKGHRLRVCIMASWFPTYSRNLQTGLSEMVSSDTRKATITIHCGPDSPSRLILPLFSTNPAF